MLNIGMTFIEHPCCRIMAIALFRNGERNDFYIGTRHCFNQGGGAFGRDKHIFDRADHG